jgi:hypothetical protein
MTTLNDAHFSVEGLLQMARDATGLSDFGPTVSPRAGTSGGAINGCPSPKWASSTRSVLGA